MWDAIHETKATQICSNYVILMLSQISEQKQNQKQTQTNKESEKKWNINALNNPGISFY